MLQNRVERDPGAAGTDHLILQGESIDSLAYEYGHSGDTIWDHPRNEQLRSRRGDFRVLYPNDVIFIPPRTVKFCKERQTARRHIFKRRDVPSVLRFHPFALSGQGMADRFEILNGEAVIGEGKTDGNGDVVWTVEPNALKVVIRVFFGEFFRDYSVQMRTLDPINTISGVQQRLASLGFYNGEWSGNLDPATEQALGNFRLTQGLQNEEILSDKVADALYRAYGEDKL